jgi:hypothetical protein
MALGLGFLFNEERKEDCMKRSNIFVIAALICLYPFSAGADLITFESMGFTENDNVGAITTATNIVSFFQNKATPGGDFALKVSQVGGTSQHAFTTTIMGSTVYDTPIGGDPGQFFLTDANIQANEESYYFQFANPVNSLSLDLYDYDNGTGEPYLTAYSNSDWTGNVGTSATIPASSKADGSVFNLSLSNPSEPFYSATLTWTTGTVDDETGIDNFAFNTVPIPGAFWLLGSSLIGIAAVCKRKIN